MSLDDLLNQQLPAGWRPNKGDKLVGKVTEVTSGWSTQSEDDYPIIVLHDEEKDESVAIHCFHHVLKNEILKLQPQIGERIAVQYNGEQPLKNNPNRSVKLYKVVIEGRKADYSKFSSPQKVDEIEKTVAETSDDEDTPF